MTEPVLRLKNIRKHFGQHHVLNGIDFDIYEHEVVVIIGASGSGKSTLMRTINLLERIDDGQIILAGEDISDPRIDEDKARARIGIVFQHFNLFPHKTVLENVSIANRIVHKVEKEEAERIGMELLKRIGIEDKAKQYPDQLSGGQQQRVAIVRAIASNPKLLLLDEITSALDPQLVGEVLDLVQELKTSGSTILMATHEMDFAKRVADRVVFLHEGKIAEVGPPKQIFENPAHPATIEFLSRLRI
ncbi:MAG: amino acid ABC transporter ATP-binding protein [Clostridiales Family XIII bacterium]|jgi:polar amino acid transport system ATP-binding protein|nr:amino acid ABC transporter ATP-binding protein [Clostridiales Family XIII bacterium]